MASIYNHVLDENDLFEIIDSDENEGSEWEKFIEDVAKDAAKPSGVYSYTEFEMFMYNRGYSDEIGDVLREAVRAFMNEHIMESDAPFEYC